VRKAYVLSLLPFYANLTPIYLHGTTTGPL